MRLRRGSQPDETWYTSINLLNWMGYGGILQLMGRNLLRYTHRDLIGALFGKSSTISGLRLIPRRILFRYALRCLVMPRALLCLWLPY